MRRLFEQRGGTAAMQVLSAQLADGDKDGRDEDDKKRWKEWRSAEVFTL